MGGASGILGDGKKAVKIHHLVKAPENTPQSISRRESWDATKPATVYKTPEILQDGTTCTAATVILRTRGCAWWWKSGCTFCGYFNDVRDDVTANDLFAQWEVAKRLTNDFKGCKMVKVYTSGTFFEDQENPPEWQEMVLKETFERGLELDVTDFKSLLTGSTELRIYIENWTQKADLVSIEFDYIDGTPDYPYYAVSEILNFHANSIDGVPYGVSHNLDLNKNIQIPSNAETTHLRTIISGWGHATPVDSDGRPCAEWCYRTHDVKINGAITYQHYMGPIGCATNPINNQAPGNWMPNRAGWCPGMAVPVRIDDIGLSFNGNGFDFEYDFQNWSSDGGSTSGQTGAYYAISSYVVVKSSTEISSPAVID